MNHTSKKSLTHLLYAAVSLSLCLLLPFLTGQIPQIGKALCPMHIPVLLCGLICGWQYGLGVGFVLPLVRSALFYMPVMFPTAIAMAFELAAYGLLSGLFARLVHTGRRATDLYLQLAGAMLAYGLWFRGIGRLSPVAVSAMSLLSPVTAVVLGWIFLGQKIQGMALMGLIVVLASVMSIQRALARQAAGAKTKKAP